MQTLNFKEVERLHKLGFALHWLKNKSKAPVHSGWTKGERAELSLLKKTYRKGYNIGVRLGRVSKIKDTYLAVIDVDIKSNSKKHKEEALTKLFEIFPEAKTAPCVLSGRGNGSSHYYVRVSKPTSGSERKAQSTEVVKVSMPSVNPSKREYRELTDKEISEGLRLRPAWEISLLCEGRQVVLPGSIHPDTGREYKWGKAVNGSGLDMPLISPQFQTEQGNSAVSNPEGTSPSVDSPKEVIKLTTVDVETLDLRPDQIEAITSGEGVEDRSAYVFGLTMSMLKKGIPKSKIISLLTDKNYWLGQTSYDHAKTESRSRAALWVQKYCILKAEKKVNESLFENEIVESDRGDGADISDYKKRLDYTQPDKRGRTKLRATFKNILLILQNEVCPNLIEYDVFSQNQFFGCDTPWGNTKGQKRSSGVEDALRIKNWVITKFKLEVNVNLIEEALTYIAGENEFHPVKQYIESLQWDGVERVEKAFKTYLNAKMPEPYLSDVSRKFFLALIKRIYEPGCKFDYLPVLEGSQGIGKSSFGQILVSPKWFMDGLPDLNDKDAALNLQGIWLCEMGELSVLHKSALEQAKAFISRQTDKIRPPYGRRRVDFPRSSVFVGTTDKKDYLSDSAGNRRFWPIHVDGCDFEALHSDREQLLAEAKAMYDFSMEPLYLKGKTLKQAQQIQETRRLDDEGDELQERFIDWLKLPEKERGLKLENVSMSQLFKAGPFTGVVENRQNRMAVSNILRTAGFIRIHTRTGKRWVTKK